MRRMAALLILRYFARTVGLMIASSRVTSVPQILRRCTYYRLDRTTEKSHQGMN
jgi:hypothetical protein